MLILVIVHYGGKHNALSLSLLLFFGFLMATLLGGIEERNRSIVQDANLFLKDLFGERNEVGNLDLDVGAHDYSLVRIIVQMVEIGLR